jgi:plasmid stability protein
MDFTIDGIEDAVMERLAAIAAANNRSVEEEARAAIVEYFEREAAREKNRTLLEADKP